MTTLNKTPLEMFYHWEQHTPDKNYLNQPVEGEWQTLTWREFADRTRRLASFLLAQDFAPYSKIAIYSKNTADWIIADMAIILAGHVSIPLLTGQTAENLQFILQQSETQLIFIGKTDASDNIYDILPATLGKVAILGGDPTQTDTTLTDILRDYPPYKENPLFDRNHLFTIVYTSGTTGNPKGVMHTFNSPASIIQHFLDALKAGENERLLSYLPLSHIAERIFVEMNSLYGGMSVYFVESLQTFRNDIQHCQPTVFLSVPRLWQKFREQIESRLPPKLLDLLLRLPLISGLIRTKIKQTLGLSQSRINLSGSAPLDPTLQQWFGNIGIPIRSAYATTESFCYGCFDLGDTPAIGTVGKALSGGEVILAENDEVLYKADCLMTGYYKLPDKTAETLKNGYYHTNDSGKWDSAGNLIITGRLSDVFKTSKGKFVQPLKLEEKLASAKLFAQLCVIGQGLAQPVLLAQLAKEFSTQNKKSLEAQINELLKQFNATVAHHEQIEQVFITAAEWSLENGLLTPTLKLKRRAIEEHYRPWVEKHLEKETVVWEHAP